MTAKEVTELLRQRCSPRNGHSFPNLGWVRGTTEYDWDEQEVTEQEVLSPESGLLAQNMTIRSCWRWSRCN